MLRKQWLMLSTHTKISRNIITMFGFVCNFAKNCFPFRKIISLTAFILFLFLLYFAIWHYINFKYCIGFLWLRNKVSQIWRLKRAEIYSLIILEVRRPESVWVSIRVAERPQFLRGPRGNLFLASSSFWWQLAWLDLGQITPISASVVIIAFSTAVWELSFYLWPGNCIESTK